MVRLLFILSFVLIACGGPEVMVREIEATCGDGNLQIGEACDDGNEDNLDACTNSCEPPAVRWGSSTRFGTGG